MRKTKVIATIGPASENEETFTALCRAGLNVARLNFSHGTHEEHKKKFDLIRKVREIRSDQEGSEQALPAHRHHAGHQGPGVPDQNL